MKRKKFNVNDFPVMYGGAAGGGKPGAMLDQLIRGLGPEAVRIWNELNAEAGERK